MKNVVFIVNLKDVKKPNRSNPYQYSINSWKSWCDKNNCELMVLEDRIYEENFMNANWHKLFIFKLLDIKYDQVLIADADTIIHPNAPNVFEQTNHQFSVVHNYGSYDFGDGAVGKILIYDRNLTADESAQNYNALKRRFS